MLCIHYSCGCYTYHLADYVFSLQDDYRVCMEFNIIQRDQEPICPVDASGCFTAEVTDFAGQYVKVSDILDTNMFTCSFSVNIWNIILVVRPMINAVFNYIMWLM